MYLKTIIQGRLEFGTEKSYEKVTKMFLQRIENYYKTDVIFKYEDILFRHVRIDKKKKKNRISLF